MLEFAIKETRGVERFTQKRERVGFAVEKDPQVAGENGPLPGRIRKNGSSEKG